ncbi:unnamed protein product [Absidia cylindrospora]
MIDEGIDNNNAYSHPSRFIQPRPSSSSNVQRHSSTFNRTRHFVSRAMHGHGSNGEYEDDLDNDSHAEWSNGKHDNDSTATAPFTSVSIDKLSFHLGKIASQFYQDLLMHTRLRYQETHSGLQSLEWQMMDLYRHLQLASSRAVMQRAMMIVQELEDERPYDHHPQQQEQHQHYSYGQGQTVGKNDNPQNNRYYKENDEDDSSSSSSSDEGGDDAYGQHQHITNRWTPICTEEYHEDRDTTQGGNSITPPLAYHSGTTTATTASSASQQAHRQSSTTMATETILPPPFQDDKSKCYLLSEVESPMTTTILPISSTHPLPPTDKHQHQQPQMQ